MNNKEITKKGHDAIAKEYYELYKDDKSDLQYFDIFLSECRAKILDLGCGMGHYSSYMHKKGFEVVGVDFSKNMIDIAQSNNSDIEFVIHDICDLSFLNDAKFDGIVLAYVLQHLSKIEVLSLFNELNQYITSDAKILIFLREGNGILQEVEPINPKYMYVINEYSKEEINKVLVDNGWKVSFMKTKKYIEDPNSLSPTTLVVIANK